MNFARSMLIMQPEQRDHGSTVRPTGHSQAVWLVISQLALKASKGGRVVSAIQPLLRFF
jgi:hypothetical protein